jgi:hypothetical protein
MVPGPTYSHSQRAIDPRPPSISRQRAPGARLSNLILRTVFSSGFRPFQPYENEAVSLRLFEHTLIPGLLQTEDYARAVLETHPNTSTEVIEERVAARLSRQEILAREDPPPPILWVLLDENVLTRQPRHSLLRVRVTFSLQSLAMLHAPLVLPVRSLSSITPRPPW